MLSFVCEKDTRDNIIKKLIEKLAGEMKLCKLETLAANHYDRDLIENLNALVEINNENSFIFDKTDLLGEEPYGIVYDFFESFKMILEEIKTEFPKTEITGHISINDIKFSCCYKESVKTTKRSSKIQFKKCKY